MPHVDDVFVSGSAMGNDHQVVGQHCSAHQQLEPLAPLRQATFHAPTTEENRYATFDARTETLALLEYGVFW
jgi:hypothetical protein